MTFVISAIQMYVLRFGHFFENQKNSGLTPVRNDDPDVKDDPNDPLTHFHVWCDQHTQTTLLRHVKSHLRAGDADEQDTTRPTQYAWLAAWRSG